MPGQDEANLPECAGCGHPDCAECFPTECAHGGGPRVVVVNNHVGAPGGATGSGTPEDVRRFAEATAPCVGCGRMRTKCECDTGYLPPGPYERVPRAELEELRAAVRAWREYARAALDAGCIRSMPGNEVPWGAGGELPAAPKEVTSV